jgi:hemolysin activation/secretion protein
MDYFRRTVPWYLSAVVALGAGVLLVFSAPAWGADKEKPVTFEIREFLIEGNKILHDDLLLKVVEPYTGKARTGRDVEAARTAVEKFYHQRGYPTALVNIPRQSIDGGAVRLEVIESKVRRVRVKGNRYFTRERLLKEMPAFRPGEVLYLPAVRQQLARVNRNPDLKVAPVLMPGKQLGTIDVEFHVKDKLPLHGGVELNNRSTHDTTDLRLNASLRYDNLWQKEHSLSGQFQTSPENTEEVQLITGSYSMPSPWDDDHMVVLYGLMSDSDTATAENVQVIGEGYIVGLRYLANLEPLESYQHNLIFGLDFKDFEEELEGEVLPVRYLPLSVSYAGTLPDKTGETRYSIGCNVAFRSLGSHVEEFQAKRSGARGNFIYGLASLARRQKLWGGWHLSAMIDGQLANQPLISNEQYVGGGVGSVRGYKESEAAGDDALHGSVELSSPDLGAVLGIGKYLEFTPYLFYDAAALKIQEPLAGEDADITLQGVGVGVRGYLAKYIEYQVDWALALEDTDTTEAGEPMAHFRVAFKF